MDRFERIHNNTPCRVGADTFSKRHLSQQLRQCVANSRCGDLYIADSPPRSVIEGRFEHIEYWVLGPLARAEYTGIHNGRVCNSAFQSRWGSRFGRLKSHTLSTNNNVRDRS